MSDSVRPQRWQPTRLPRPWDSPGKNTGVGCHFLLQCMKAKSESEVAQSCLTQLPHGLQPTRLLHLWDFPGKSTGVGCHCLLRASSLGSNNFTFIYWCWKIGYSAERGPSGAMEWGNICCYTVSDLAIKVMESFGQAERRLGKEVTENYRSIQSPHCTGSLLVNIHTVHPHTQNPFQKFHPYASFQNILETHS